MGTSSFADRALRRRKWIAGVIVGAFSVTVVVVVLAFWRTRTRKGVQALAPPALPHNVHQQLSGYSITRSDEGRQIFTVRAARTLAMNQGGTTYLEDVSVEFFGREGNRHDILRTGQCEYHPDAGDLFGSGKVELELNAPRQAGGAGSAPPNLGGREPVFLETSNVSFRQRGSMLTTDQPVRFRVGTATGSALGMSYATKDDWLELKKDIRMEWLPTAKGNDRLPVRLQARSLRYESLRGLEPEIPGRGEGAAVSLTGPLEITQGGRHVSADRALLLLDARGRVTRVRLEGHVHVAESSDGSKATVSAERVGAEFDPSRGELKFVSAEGGVVAEALSKGGESSVSRLAADQIELHFRGVHPLPESGRALGNARITQAGADSAYAGARQPGRGPAFQSAERVGGPAFRSPSGEGGSVERRTLTASEIDFDFRAGGWDLKEIRTAGPGELSVVPRDPRVGERIVSGGQLVIGLDRGAQVRTLSGLSGTHVVFEPASSSPPGSPVRESFSESLEGKFDPSTRTLSEMTQTGNFRFADAERRATADRANYSSSTQVFEFAGHPWIEDDDGRVSADRIVDDLRTDVAQAMGHVRSVHLPGSAGVSPATPAGVPADAKALAGVPAAPHSSSPAGKERARDARAPDAEPTHVIADRLVLQKRSQVARYEGHVRAWQGSTLVESAWLEVYRTGRRMTAGGHVSTSSLQFGPAGQAPAKTRSSGSQAEPVLIRADRLEAVDDGARAIYRGNVQFQTEKTELSADRAEVFFSRARAAEPSGIERAQVDGHVRVIQPGRRATGEHADYDAAAGKIVLSGGRPVLEDADKGSTTGRNLTFFIHDDRLLVDGDAKSPVVSTHRVAQ